VCDLFAHAFFTPKNMALLALNVDKTELILTSSVSNDILDRWLNDVHLSTYNYLQLDYTRNCCSSNALSFKIYPEYPFGIDINYDGVYIPGGLTVNDAVIEFGITGIDESLIASATITTNENNPSTGVFETLDKTANEVVSGITSLYYLIGGANFDITVTITTTEGITYTLVYTVNPGTSFVNPALDTEITLTSVTNNSTGVPAVDSNTAEIIFDLDALNQTSSDDMLLDGVYNIGISLVTTTTTEVDSINQFFNIRLNCIITTLVADLLTDNTAFMLVQALNTADSCNMTAEQKCTLYDALIRKLTAMGQTKSVQKLGCKCGCK